MSGVVLEYFTEAGVKGWLFTGIGQVGNVSHAVDAEAYHAFFSFLGHYFSNGGSVYGETVP